MQNQNINPEEGGNQINKHVNSCVDLCFKDLGKVVINPSATRKTVRFKGNSITIDEYTFYLEPAVIYELKYFWEYGWKDAEIPKQKRKEYLLYFAKAFALLGHVDKENVYGIIKKLDYRKFALKEFIETIFESVYDWTFQPPDKQ